MNVTKHPQIIIVSALLAAAVGCTTSSSPSPGFYYSTFTSADDEVEGPRGAQVAVDSKNNIYVVGHTKSADFPAVKGALSETSLGGNEIFIAKFDPQLKVLLAATFLGGAGDDTETAAVMDDEGHLYVAGMTTSTGFPAKATSFRGGDSALSENARLTFVVKISGDLTRILGAAVVTSETDRRGGIWKILYDRTNDRLVLGGTTSATDLPVTPGAFQPTYGGGRTDEFIAVLNPALSEVLAATYLGGGDYESTYSSLGLDAGGFIFIGGNTVSKDFPVTAQAYQREHAGGGYAGHVSKFSGDLKTLAASTFVTAPGGVFLYCLTVDREGRVVFAGHGGPDAPTTPGAYKRTFKGIPDAANVGVLSNDLARLEAGTFISGGGEGSDLGGFAWFSNVMTDAQGNVFVMGQNVLPQYPTTSGVLDETGNGGEDVIVTKLDPGLTRILASTCLGGSGNDRGGTFLLERSGHVILTGSATTSDFPVGPEAFDRIFDGKQDVFVARFGPDLAAPELAAAHGAAASGDAAEVEKLLRKQPALIGHRDRYQRTLLHGAARFSQIEVLSLLLEAKPDVNAADESGRTPLHLAVLGEHLQAVAALLAGQADPNLKSLDGNTPLHLAANLGNEDIINLLVTGKADLEARNKDGNTPLHRAVFSRQKTAVETLLNRQADIRAKNDRGFTPLHLSVIVVRNNEIVAELVKRGAPLNERNLRSETPLHLAVRYPGDANWPELMKANPDVNAKDGDGCLALHYAAYYGRVELVKEMRRRNVDVSVKDKDGLTALDYAREAKRGAVVELLKK